MMFEKVLIRANLCEKLCSFYQVLIDSFFVPTVFVSYMPSLPL